MHGTCMGQPSTVQLCYNITTQATGQLTCCTAPTPFRRRCRRCRIVPIINFQSLTFAQTRDVDSLSSSSTSRITCSALFQQQRRQGHPASRPPEESQAHATGRRRRRAPPCSCRRAASYSALRYHGERMLRHRRPIRAQATAAAPVATVRRCQHGGLPTRGSCGSLRYCTCPATELRWCDAMPPQYSDAPHACACMPSDGSQHRTAAAARPDTAGSAQVLPEAAARVHCGTCGRTQG